MASTATARRANHPPENAPPPPPPVLGAAVGVVGVVGVVAAASTVSNWLLLALAPPLSVIFSVTVTSPAALVSRVAVLVVVVLV